MAWAWPVDPGLGFDRCPLPFDGAELTNRLVEHPSLIDKLTDEFITDASGRRSLLIKPSYGPVWAALDW